MSLKVFKQLLGKHANDIIVSGNKIDMTLSQLKESKNYDAKNVEKSPFKFIIESNRFPDIDLDDNNHSKANDYLFNRFSNKQCYHCGSQNIEKGYYKNDFFCHDCKDGGDIKLLFNSLGKSQSNKSVEENMLKELSKKKSLKQTKKNNRDKIYKKIQQNR